jgi:hypothetical protein
MFVKMGLIEQDWRQASMNAGIVKTQLEADAALTRNFAQLSAL